MLTIKLDFHYIDRLNDFYHQFAVQSGCPFIFGANLDAFWDWLTGGMALPAQIQLIHLADHPHPEYFTDAVHVIHEASASLQGALLVKQLV